MSASLSNIFESAIAIVSNNRTLANILRDQCLLYGFTHTTIFTDWDTLLPTFSQHVPDIIVSDQPPTFRHETLSAYPAHISLYDMIPVVLYSQGQETSLQEAIPEGLTIVASLHGRDEQQRLLEVIHEELDKRYFDIGKYTFSQPTLHLNIVIGTNDRDLGAQMRQVLEQQGYYVSVVENGTEALTHIEGIYPHVVFLDEHLPELNGLTVFQWIKSVSPNTVVLLMGDSDSPELVTELLKAGVHSYLHKPFAVESLPILCQGIAQIYRSPKETEDKKLAPEPEQAEQTQEELDTLRKSEENLRTLINASGDIIFQITPQGFLNFATPAVQEQLGYSWVDLEEERINIAKFVHPEDFIRVMVGIRQVIRGSAIKGMECRLMHQDKTQFRWYSINCYPMYNSQRQFVGVGGIARDIGSIKSFEQQIRKQNERLAALNEIARIVSQSLDLNEILRDVTDKVLEIIRLQAGGIFLFDPETRQFHLRSCRVDQQTSPDQKALLEQCRLHEVFPSLLDEQKEPVVIHDIAGHPHLSRTIFADIGFQTLLTVPLKSKDVLIGMMVLLSREQRLLQENDTQLLISLGNQVGMMIENIKLYQQEMQAKQRLEELNKLKDDFVAIVSHDLRSPLTAILSASEILLNDGFMDRALTDEQKELVGNIQSMGNQQLQLVSDLLDLAKIESGKLELNRSIIDIRTIAQQCYNALAVLADNKNITLNFVAEPDLPKISVDAPKIRQVINNLISNAIKFTEPGGMVTLRIDTEQHKQIRIAINDTGQGIEPEHLRLLFNKFQQVRSHGTHGERGTGLGLSICKNLVELHQGEIWAESRVGVGSTFIFTLPVPERIILIIDDSLTVIKAMKGMILPNLKYIDVKYAMNGQEGLKLIEQTFPAVLIMDYMMPEMDGLSTFRELKKRYGARVPPTIFLTATRDLEVKRQIFELGADDYLEKPVDVSDLLPRLSRFL